MSPRLPDFVDERFLHHRLRSSSTAGMIAAALAVLLCLFRFYQHGQVDRYLIAVALVFLVVKYAPFFWYRRAD